MSEGLRTHQEESSFRRRFLASLTFSPDDFQLDAFDVIDEGANVLVAAPTGSGKTLVAAYGVAQAVERGKKAYYTTPLKALSNQKFSEFCSIYGAQNVGLLTGDVAIRPHAQVVVMTTEVLRNMVLAQSTLLHNLRCVVLDEVHYLQDPYRGGVWEEVLVLCPKEVQFICLSATIANAQDFGSWLRSIRGRTEVIVERQRPVTLRHHVAFHRRHGGENTVLGTQLLPLLSDGRIGGEASRLDEWARRVGARNYGHRRGAHRDQLGVRTPRRSELLEALYEEELLPAIVFIFSRAGCEEAVRQCMRDGIRLSDSATRHAIRRIAETHVRDLSDEALDVLGYSEWLEGLESGLGAHHAGLVPAFRETVEECFAAGYLGAVFATETLSLGINMPARTVVLERFEKFGGAGRASLTSGEYAQLTGRAGRRGLDEEGHAVSLWSYETSVKEMAKVILAPLPDLRSAFRPTYNLSVNLVKRFDRATAEAVLGRSFAQWQQDAHAQRIGKVASGPTALAEILDRRLHVLERHGFVDGWSVTKKGMYLSHIYHECDLVIAEALTSGVFEDLEPALLAGVLSALVFEPRRARRGFAGAASAKAGQSRNGERPQRGKRKGAGIAGDRLGEGRRRLLGTRLEALELLSERVRASEEEVLLPRMRAADGSLGPAVAAWARGAPLGTVLTVAAHDVGEIAPGDFVRTIKQLIDLVGQVGEVTTNEGVASAAEGAIAALRRDVVGISVVEEWEEEVETAVS